MEPRAPVVWVTGLFLELQPTVPLPACLALAGRMGRIQRENCSSWRAGIFTGQPAKEARTIPERFFALQPTGRSRLFFSSIVFIQAVRLRAVFVSLATAIYMGRPLQVGPEA